MSYSYFITFNVTCKAKLIGNFYIAKSFKEREKMAQVLNSGVFQVLLLLILILVNAFFAMSEIAIITLNDNKLKNLAKKGHKGAEKILKVTKNSNNFLATIQVGVTLSGFLTSASASTIFASKVADFFSFLPLSSSILEGFSTVLITLILSYFFQVCQGVPVW
jgi:CBS domain containing-hemolysin-like protein